MQHAKIRIALAGNPNSGKTTLFNALTGARQHVGNYPGVTVEKKEGSFVDNGVRIDVVDLPGTYSLTAHSPEELVARNVVLEEAPDVVVDVIDASNLERNLYLATQFMELGVPMILALNMADVAEARGHSIDLELLSQLLKVPIVRTVASKEQGLDELKRAIREVAMDGRAAKPATVAYGRHIDAELDKLTEQLRQRLPESTPVPARWIALKLLENDEVVADHVRYQARDADEIFAAVERSRDHLQRELGDDTEILIADRRYGFISGACQEAVRSTVESRHTMSDRVDLVMTHRVLSIPIFLVLMYLVFNLTFTVGEPIMGWIESLFGLLGDLLTRLWPQDTLPLLQSLVVDGVIGGVGGVLVFVPNILLLFLAIAVLEDSGYMARAAFIVDRFMHRLGLHGKSFIPMLIGFGCTVPAIMATRTLESRRDRMTTMLVAPLMSCGARLPIYALIIPAFFPPAWHARMLWTIYFIGIALAIVLAKLLRSTLFRGETAPFVMELPPYRMPTMRGVLVHMWERGWLYVKKAGTVILGISVVMWALATFPRKTEFDTDYDGRLAAIEALEWSEEDLDQQVSALENERQAEILAYTVAGRIGHGLEPILRPLGFDWRIGTALIGAFAAKEVFVAQMGIVYAVGEADEESSALRRQLRENYNALQGFCIMLFCLISAPCMATIAATRRESNSWGWAMLQLGGLTVLAYFVTLIVYQAGSLLGIGT
jgi:ferrous iron transport protein B